MKFHSIPNAKPSSGHYTPAISANGFLFISGQVPSNPITGEICKGSIEEQFSLILNNLKDLLTASNAKLEDVLKVNIYIPNGDNWGIINEMFADFFGKHKPTRVIIPCGKLHNDYQVELEAIALSSN